MKNKPYNSSSSFFRITSIALPFILLFPFLVAKGEGPTNTPSKDVSVTGAPVKVPVAVASWMDDELNKASRKTLLSKDDFFTKDTARVVGYIAGYGTDLGFANVLLNATNDLTNEARPLVSSIDSIGRFTCSIPMNHPSMVTISFGEKFMPIYLEPGQTLAMSFGWKDCVRTNCFRDVKEVDRVLLLQGPLARLNYELKEFQLKTMGYRHYWIKDRYSPEEYLSAMDSIFDENNARVKEALASGKYLEKTIEIRNNEALMANGHYLLDYASQRDTKGITLPRGFYHSLEQLPLNDPSCIVSSSFKMFINRFELNPVVLKAHRVEYGESPRSKKYLEEWIRKDSLLKSDFNLSNNFCYEVTKIRKLSSELEFMQKREAYDYFYALQAGIKHPFLKQEGFRILASLFGNDNLGDKNTDGGFSLPENADEESRWLPRSLPEGLDADIFSKLMADHKGKYVFVDFWGTSCGPCRGDINSSKEMREQCADSPDFDFVFVTCKDWSPNKKVYDDYVKEQNLKHSYFISDDDFKSMMQLFRFTGIPHYVFIDPDGNVLDANFIRLDFEEAIKWIQEQ